MASLRKISKNTILLFIRNPTSSGEKCLIREKQERRKVGQVENTKKLKGMMKRGREKEKKREKKEHRKRC